MTGEELKRELMYIQDKCNPVSTIWQLIELMIKVTDQFFPPEIDKYPINTVK